jgi:hypothetical protein
MRARSAGATVATQCAGGDDRRGGARLRRARRQRAREQEAGEQPRHDAEPGADHFLGSQSEKLLDVICWQTPFASQVKMMKESDETDCATAAKPGWL